MDKQCVDIDDVLNLFGVEDEDLYATGTIEDALYDGALKIYELPSAERRGQWKDIPFTARWICSNCDYISEFASFKYCPDCGARMDLEKNDG